MPFLPDTDNELSAIEQFNVDLNRIRNYQATATPQQAYGVGTIGSYYPTIKPGVAYTLGTAGYTPYDDLTRRAADVSTKAGARGGYVQPGTEKVVGRKKRKKKGKPKEDDGGGGLFGTGIGPDVGLSDVADVIPGVSVAKHAAEGVGELIKGNPVGAVASGIGLRDLTDKEKTAVDHVKDVPYIGRPIQEGAALLKPIARYGFVALNAPLEYVQAGVRSTADSFANIPTELAGGNVGNAIGLLEAGTLGMAAPVAGAALTNELLDRPQTAQLEQTTLGQVGKNLLEGKPVHLGQGYLPSMNGNVARAQAEAARKYGPQIQGHGFTIGRFYAGLVTEEDSVAFNVLSGLVDAKVALSPVDIGGSALTAVGDARKAAKTFAPAYETAGLVDGARKSLRRPTADQWMDSKDGQVVRKFLREETDPVEIWRKTNKKIPLLTPDGRRPLVELADARTDAEVDEILRPLLGLDIEQTFKVGGIGYQFRSATSNFRMIHPVPGRLLNPDDLDTSAVNLENWLVNGKVPQVERDPILNRLMRAQSGKERFGVAEAAGSAVEQQLLKRGVDAATAKWRTTIYQERLSDATKYFVDEVGSNGWDPILAIGGEARPLPSPHLLAEQLSGPITLPDPKAIRRLASVVKEIDEIPMVGNLRQGMAGAIDGFMEYWRDFHLLRPAWTLRFMADEQARMAGSGYDSMFRHPFSYMAVVAGAHPDSKLYKMLTTLSEKTPLGLARKIAPKGESDIAGGPLFSELNDAAQESLMSSFGAYRPQERGTKHWDVIPREHPDYAKGLLGELGQLHRDKLARAILEETDPGAIKQSFWDGPLSQYRTQLSETEDMAQALETRAGADYYIDTVYHRIKVKTSHDHRLVDAVRTGKLNGHPLASGDSKKAIEELKAIVGDAEGALVGPEKVKIQKWMTLGSDTLRNEDRTKANKALDWGYDMLLTKPSNYFNRSATYNQDYWGHVPDLVSHTDEAGKAKALAAARQSNMPQSVIDTIANVKPTGKVTWETIDKVAQKRALDTVKKIHYDLSERNQFFDVFKLIFPFGDAWKEILTRWSNIAYENPKVFRRGQQAIQGARGSGFFHTNANGEEVFTYPGSEWLTDKLIGVPVPLTGRVNGLNMIGEGLPGVGPAVSIPAAYFIPDQPQWDDLASIFNPYGAPQGDLVTAVFDSLVPAWAQKFRTALGDPTRQRDWNNTVMDVARYLSSTGEYDLQGDNAVKEQARLMQDAKEKAKWFDFIRGGAQAVSPSAPAPEWQIEDPKGKLIIAQKVMDEYRKKQDKLGYDEALDWFIDTYGEDNFLAIQPKSRVLVAGVPVTKPGMDWARSHPELMKKFSHVYGFFAPQEGDFDISVYQRQFSRGEREALTVEEMVAEANNRIGAHQYKLMSQQIDEANTAAGRASRNDIQRAALRQIRSVLADAYPGFNTFPFDDKKVPVQVKELVAAASDPVIARTDAGKGMKIYLEQRAAVLKAAQGMGLAGFATAKQTAPLRAFLRTAATVIIAEHPDFAPVWEQVFAREMKEDEPVG